MGFSHTHKRKVIPAIYHCNIQIISRSKGRSAVAAAAYRSGEKLTNNWDGLTHDYTKKGGVIHSEILLPSHAPPEYVDRSTLWNAVEMVEKNCNAQLAREINVALPVELSCEQQIQLVREYCQSNFVSVGMCVDFAIHDTNAGNPHAHIMLTMRPIKEDGTWDDKQRKVYRLDENGQKIYDPIRRQYDCDSIHTTDWNERTKAEEWRASWASLTNQYLEQNGIQARVDHRNYRRQGIEQIPTIHLGPAATQMERRGIRTEKGDINRQIAADNKELKIIRARLSRLSAGVGQYIIDPQKEIMQVVMERILHSEPTDSQYQKIRNLKNASAVLNFMQTQQIYSVADLQAYNKEMNSNYYAIRKDITSCERRMKTLDERLSLWEQYEKYKHVRKQLDKIKPGKREKFIEDNRAALALFDRVCNHFDELESAGERITPKSWKKELDSLTAEHEQLTEKMHKLKDELTNAENIHKALQVMAKEEIAEKKHHIQQIQQHKTPTGISTTDFDKITTHAYRNPRKRCTSVKIGTSIPVLYPSIESHPCQPRRKELLPMAKRKEPVITVKSVFHGTKTDRQAFIELILQRQLQDKNNIINRKETVDAEPNLRYNEGTPIMRYTQANGGN